MGLPDLVLPLNMAFLVRPPCLPSSQARDSIQRLPRSTEGLPLAVNPYRFMDFLAQGKGDTNADSNELACAGWPSVQASRE